MLGTNASKGVILSLGLVVSFVNRLAGAQSLHSAISNYNAGQQGELISRSRFHFHSSARLTLIVHRALSVCAAYSSTSCANARALESNSRRATLLHTE